MRTSRRDRNFKIFTEPVLPKGEILTVRFVHCCLGKKAVPSTSWTLFQKMDCCDVRGEQTTNHPVKRSAHLCVDSQTHSWTSKASSPGWKKCTGSHTPMQLQENCQAEFFLQMSERKDVWSKDGWPLHRENNSRLTSFNQCQGEFLWFYWGHSYVLVLHLPALPLSHFFVNGKQSSSFRSGTLIGHGLWYQHRLLICVLGGNFKVEWKEHWRWHTQTHTHTQFHSLSVWLSDRIKQTSFKKFSHSN